MIFSVAIPVFKQAEFLPASLASVVAQARPFQLAVMDATPDDSVQRVLTAYTKVLHYSRHGPDSGQAAAIQEGWDHTTGEIVHWLCADDYLFPDAFAAVEQVFLDRPDVDVVYGDSVFVNETGAFIRYFPSISGDISRIVRDCCISQPSCFVRRAAMERVGKLNTELHYIMDWDLWTRLYKDGAKFRYLHRPLSVTRMYPGTKTTSNVEGRASEIRAHLAQHAGYLSAMRSRLGSRLARHDYAEVRGNAYSILEDSVLSVLSLLRRIKRHAIGFATQGGPETLYGVDIVTNDVRGSCDIFLPMYEDQSPRFLTVTSENNVRLKATINKKSLSGGQARSDGKLFIQSFELSPVSSASRLLHITLENAEPFTWKLISVRLE